MTQIRRCISPVNDESGHSRDTVGNPRGKNPLAAPIPSHRVDWMGMGYRDAGPGAGSGRNEMRTRRPKSDD
jgi:hypothetical protein